MSRFKAGAGFGADAALSSGFGFLVILLAARSGSVPEFGQFALILAIVAAQAPLATFGLTTLAYGRAAARPAGARHLLGSAMVIVGAAGAGLYAVTLLAFALFAGDTLTMLYAAAGLRLIGAVGVVLPQDAMARQAPGEYLPARLLTVTLAAVAAVAAWYMEAPFAMLALIWGTESLGFSVLCALTLGRRRARLNRRNRYRPYLAKAAPIALQGLFIVIYLRFDQIYVGWRFGEDSLGLYAAAARIAELGNLGFNVLTLIVSPMIIAQMRASGRLDRRALLFLAILAGVTVLASASAAVMGGSVLGLVFGPAYAAAGLILAVYLGSIFFVAYGAIGSRVVAAQGVSGPQIWSGLAGAFSNVVLSIALGEMIGLEGVALGTVISYALAAGVLWHAARRNQGGTARDRQVSL